MRVIDQNFTFKLTLTCFYENEVSMFCLYEAYIYASVTNIVLEGHCMCRIYWTHN